MSSKPTNGNGNGNAAKWQIWISGLSLAISIIAGFWYLTSQIATLSVKADTAAVERQQLQARLSAVEAVQAGRQIDVARLQASLIEVETQFCAMTDYENLQHANDLRNFAAVYEKVTGQHYPLESAFFRQCNRPPAP